MPKIIYQFDQKTREYAGQINAQLSPLESTAKKEVYFSQANTVSFAPPKKQAGFAFVLNAGMTAWDKVEDHRGKVYDTVTGEESTYADLGVLPTNLTATAPAPNSTWDTTAHVWVFDAVQAAAKQAASINAACAALIVGGFTSSALGATHTYDSKMEDQLNLIGAASAAIAMPYTCIDAAGVKAEVTHTASQIKKVFDDGLAFKSTQLSKARTLKAQLDVLVANAATTQADIDLVVWV